MLHVGKFAHCRGVLFQCGLGADDSPELNPEERLNADLKHTIGTKVPVRTKAKWKTAATEHMIRLENSPERVKRFFLGPRVK